MPEQATRQQRRAGALRTFGAQVCAQCAAMLATRRGWRQLLTAALIFFVLGGTGALVYLWAGLAPVAASAGHWPVTRAMLTFAMRNAVETRAMGRSVPPLDDPTAVALGARHYASQCAICHGAPGKSPLLTMQQMTPHPPRLPDELRSWTPQQLFWIVHNGIKFTAMPAWPAAARDDEVWVMVAFLQELPHLDAAAYDALVGGTVAGAPTGIPIAIQPVLATCERCHGAANRYRERGRTPRLAGQTREYLAASLRAFAAGSRHSGIMQPVAAALDDNAIEWLADHYATTDVQPATAEDEPAAALVRRGESIAHDGSPALGIPSCMECHGPGAAKRNRGYPRLAGQPAPYLTLQLQRLRDGSRGGTAYAPIMMEIAQRLDDAEIAALAAYYSSATE